MNKKEKAKKLSDGIFELTTIRFGKIPEIMIKRMFRYAFADGTSDYDLKRKRNGKKERIEVKFSCVRESEKYKIEEDNVLKICLNNPSSDFERKVNSNEISKKKFDCNIQQVKPACFDYLYYGLFFEDKIAVFMISSDEVKHSFLLTELAKYIAKMHKIDKIIEEIVPRLDSSKKIDENYVEGRVFKKNNNNIPNLLEEAYNELKVIDNDEAKEFIKKEKLKEKTEKILEEYSENKSQKKQNVNKAKKFCDYMISNYGERMIPNSSSKQHKGNVGEGQFHINNENINWHLDSNYFKKWISYEELYDVFEKCQK